MHIHPPTVGGSSQPIEGNDCEIMRLREAYPVTEAVRSLDATLRCGLCWNFFRFNEGYDVRSDFYCDDCMDVLARNGEFS
jgi:hypothetical protein